ncbi:MAG: head GIN domain-containing protein [Ginsengibacter sp.]
MKKLFLPVFMLMSFNIYAQIWKSVKGDGNLKNETRQVDEFTSLSSRGPLDVQIEYGNSNSIKIEADENLLPFIETTVENGKLTIEPKKNINLKSRSKIIVHVFMTKIKELQLSGSGNINGSGAFTSDGETEVDISGSGNIKLNSVNFKEVALNISGSGNIQLKDGDANDLKASVSGSGNIDCSGVASENADVKISGSGNASVNVNKSLSANISGSGNVFYKGNATNISTKVVGSGKAIKS